MPPEATQSAWQARRQAIRTAKRLAGMLQGTMGLEGQGLSREALRIVRKQMVRRILGSNP